MRNVVLFIFVTIDGVAEEPGDWFFDDSPELFAHIGAVIGLQSDVLLGRGTYDYWAPHWPTTDLEPFAPFINGTTKHVASSTDLHPEWANSVRITEPVVDHLHRLRQQPGGDIGVHASVKLARSLLSAGEVDELRLVIAPALAGHGERLFNVDRDELQRFALVEATHTPQGTMLVHYRRAEPRG
jgi:dihydrofolate reductase